MLAGMHKAVLVAILLLSACGTTPPPRQDSGSPCAGGETSRACQEYRYRNTP